MFFIQETNVFTALEIHQQIKLHIMILLKKIIITFLTRGQILQFLRICVQYRIE